MDNIESDDEFMSIISRRCDELVASISAKFTIRGKLQINRERLIASYMFMESEYVREFITKSVLRSYKHPPGTEAYDVVVLTLACEGYSVNENSLIYPGINVEYFEAVWFAIDRMVADPETTGVATTVVMGRSRRGFDIAGGSSFSHYSVHTEISANDIDDMTRGGAPVRVMGVGYYDIVEDTVFDLLVHGSDYAESRRWGPIIKN